MIFIFPFWFFKMSSPNPCFTVVTFYAKEGSSSVSYPSNIFTRDSPHKKVNKSMEKKLFAFFRRLRMTLHGEGREEGGGECSSARTPQIFDI